MFLEILLRWMLNTSSIWKEAYWITWRSPCHYPKTSRPSDPCSTSQFLKCWAQVEQMKRPSHGKGQELMPFKRQKTREALERSKTGAMEDYLQALPLESVTAENVAVNLRVTRGPAPGAI